MKEIGMGWELSYDKRFMFEISILHPNEYIKWEVAHKSLKLKRKSGMTL